MRKAKTVLHYTIHAKGSKLAGIVSLNTSVQDNAYCASKPTEICRHCYASRAQAFHTNIRAPFLENLLALNVPLTDEHLLLPKPWPFVRFHSFGELSSVVHAANFVRMAILNPATSFTLWTKRPELLVGLVIPVNFHVIYSIGQMNLTETAASEILKAVQYRSPFIEAAYYVGDKAHGFKPCGSSCATCRRCYPPKPGDLISQLVH